MQFNQPQQPYAQSLSQQSSQVQPSEHERFIENRYIMHDVWRDNKRKWDIIQFVVNSIFTLGGGVLVVLSIYSFHLNGMGLYSLLWFGGIALLAFQLLTALLKTAIVGEQPALPGQVQDAHVNLRVHVHPDVSQSIQPSEQSYYRPRSSEG